MVEEHISGQIIASYAAYVKKKYGKDGIEEMSKVLGEDMGNISDSKTYPAQTAADLMNYLKDTYGLEELFKLGRFTVANVGTKRYFSLFISTENIIPRMVESVQKVNDSISLTAEYGNNSATVTVTGSEMLDVQREFWRGMMQGIFDLNKTTGKVEVDDSKMRSHGQIVYKLTW